MDADEDTDEDADEDTDEDEDAEEEEGEDVQELQCSSTEPPTFITNVSI